MRQAGDVRKTEVVRQKGYMKQTEGVCQETGELRKIELRKTRDVRRET